ncbi:molybdopterin-guanine dinucleotide biosynthesis protein B [compost metagenome]
MEEQLLAYAHLDYIFIEGFKKEKHPKIVVYRTMEQKEMIEALVPGAIAAASDLALHDQDGRHPIFNLNDISGIADWIEQFFKNCQF